MNKTLLEQAKKLEKRFKVWNGQREGFIIKADAKELLVKAEKGCAKRISGDNRDGTYQINCGDFNYFCSDCKESQEILRRIIG